MPRCAICKADKPLDKFRLISLEPERYSKECLLCLRQAGVVNNAATRREATKQALIEETVQREMAGRELARRRLMHYVMRFQKNYLPGWVHWDICARLERFMRDVEEGKSPRLMLFVPPRHGKSTLASENFPSWLLGHHPDWEIINASYAATLPNKFSRRIRQRMRSKEYTSLFKVRLDPDVQNVEGWETTAHGGYTPVGRGGGITGKGAHVLIIDDPLKDAEEADSQTIRESLHDWYSSTAYTRLAPGGGVLIIQTRWHDADLAGHCLEQDKELRREGAPEEELENWEVVSYPAIAANDEWLEESTGKVAETEKPGYRLVRRKGEALHPERFPLRLLLKYRRTLQPRHWAALYQQTPVPDEGIYFQKDWFKEYIEPFGFEGMTALTAWDLAIGRKQTNDYSVGIAGYMDWKGDLFITEMVRGRMKTAEIATGIVVLGKRYDCRLLGVEYGQLFLAVRPSVEEQMDVERHMMTIDEELKPFTDKEARARELQAMMQQGRVRFPRGQPWLEVVMHELMRFPSGVHDDIVDALAWFAILAKKTPRPRPIRKVAKVKSWKDDLGKYVAGYGDRKAMAA